MEAAPFAGMPIEGYEIHMGQTERLGGMPFCRFADGTEDGAAQGLVFGSYLHGLFDSGALTAALAEYLAGRRGLNLAAWTPEPRRAYREREYDRLAAAVRQSLDMDAIYRAMEEYEHAAPSAR